MSRAVLYFVLLVLFARALSRLWSGILEGLGGPPAQGRGAAGGVPQRGVQMVRDPVCGTFVVPDRAVSLAVKGTEVFFCSTSCRDRYVSGARQPEPVERRPA